MYVTHYCSKCGEELQVECEFNPGYGLEITVTPCSCTSKLPRMIDKLKDVMIEEGIFKTE